MGPTLYRHSVWNLLDRTEVAHQFPTGYQNPRDICQSFDAILRPQTKHRLLTLFRWSFCALVEINFQILDIFSTARIWWTLNTNNTIWVQHMSEQYLNALFPFPFYVFATFSWPCHRMHGTSHPQKAMVASHWRTHLAIRRRRRVRCSRVSPTRRRRRCGKWSCGSSLVPRFRGKEKLPVKWHISLQ